MMMPEFIKNIFFKSFWYLWSGYVLLFIMLTYKYFRAKSVIVNKIIYEDVYLIQMVPVAIILLASLFFKIVGFPRLANAVVAVPAILFLGYFIIIALMWFFLAVLFNIKGK
jgi:hypothetical protein